MERRLLGCGEEATGMWRGGYWGVESIGYWDVARRLLGCREEATGMWRGGYWDVERRLLGSGALGCGAQRCREITASRGTVSEHLLQMSALFSHGSGCAAVTGCCIDGRHLSTVTRKSRLSVPHTEGAARVPAGLNRQTKGPGGTGPVIPNSSEMSR